MKKLSLLILLGLLAVPLAGHAAAGPDEDGVSQLLMSMFDKPDNHLNIRPIVINGDHGIADWDQGNTGGRALLQRKGGTWTLRLCSGDNLKNSAMLVEAGIDQAAADSMTAALASAESALQPSVVAKYSLFEGTMVMNGSQ